MKYSVNKVEYDFGKADRIRYQYDIEYKDKFERTVSSLDRILIDDTLVFFGKFINEVRKEYLLKKAYLSVDEHYRGLITKPIEFNDPCFEEFKEITTKFNSMIRNPGIKNSKTDFYDYINKRTLVFKDTDDDRCTITFICGKVNIPKRLWFFQMPSTNSLFSDILNGEDKIKELSGQEKIEESLKLQYQCDRKAEELLRNFYTREDKQVMEIHFNFKWDCSDDIEKFSRFVKTIVKLPQENPTTQSNKTKKSTTFEKRQVASSMKQNDDSDPIRLKIEIADETS